MFLGLADGLDLVQRQHGLVRGQLADFEREETHELRTGVGPCAEQILADLGLDMAL